MSDFPTPIEILPTNEGAESGVGTVLKDGGSELQGSGPSSFITGVLARLEATDLRCHVCGKRFAARELHVYQEDREAHLDCLVPDIFAPRSLEEQRRLQMVLDIS